MKALANHYRQPDEDPYVQAYPAPDRTAEPDSPWIATLWIAFAIACLAVCWLIATGVQAPR